MDQLFPPTELLSNWEDQFFDEGENLDVLLIAAFQAGVKLGYEKCNDDHALPATVSFSIDFGDLLN